MAMLKICLNECLNFISYSKDSGEMTVATAMKVNVISESEKELPRVGGTQ